MSDELKLTGTTLSEENERLRVALLNITCSIQPWHDLCGPGETFYWKPDDKKSRDKITVGMVHVENAFQLLADIGETRHNVPNPEGGKCD